VGCDRIVTGSWFDGRRAGDFNRRMTFRALLVAVILLLSMLPDAARAEGDMALLRPSRTLTDVFAPDPPVAWREVRRFNATSDCLGRPVSVMCAVDTLMACIHRESMADCRSQRTAFVDRWADDAIGDRPPKLVAGYETFWRYRVYRVYRADRAAGEPPPDPQTRPRAVRVHLRSLSCSAFLPPPRPQGCSSSGILIVTLIRHRDGSWGVTRWNFPRG